MFIKTSLLLLALSIRALSHPDSVPPFQPSNDSSTAWIATYGHDDASCAKPLLNTTINFTDGSCFPFRNSTSNVSVGYLGGNIGDFATLLQFTDTACSSSNLSSITFADDIPIPNGNFCVPIDQWRNSSGSLMGSHRWIEALSINWNK